MAPVRMRAVLVLGLVLGLVATGCTRTRDADDVVRDAVARTVAGDVAYALTAAADRAALEALGPDAAPVASALNGFAVIGARAGGANRVVLQVRGDVRIAELVTLPDGAVFLRTDLEGLEGDGLERLLTDLADSGAPRSVVEGVAAVFSGGWVGVRGEASLDDLLGALPETGPSPSVTDVPSTDVDPAAALSAVLGAAEVTEGRDLPGGAVSYPLEIAAADVARGLDVATDALVDVPVVGPLVAGLTSGTVSGDVVVADGVVTSVLLRLQAGSADAGNLELRLDLSDHGEVAPITAPAATLVEAEDLAKALVALLSGASP